MKKYLLTGLLASFLVLGGCGGGNDTPVASPAASDSATVNAVTTASATATVDGQTLSATSYYVQDPSISVVLADAFDGFDWGNWIIPVADQGGAVLILSSSLASGDLSKLDARELVILKSGVITRLSLVGSGWQNHNGTPRQGALFIPNGLKPDRMALRFHDPVKGDIWLAASLVKATKSHRTYSAGQLTGELSANLLYRPVLQARDDASGSSALIATLLRKAAITRTEPDVRTALVANINSLDPGRTSVSLADVQRYLRSLNLTAEQAYLTEGGSPGDTAAVNAALQQSRSMSLAVVDLFGKNLAVQITAVDDTYVYMASPHFGNLAVPVSEIDTVWPEVSPGVHLLLKADIPEGWSLP